MAKRTVLMAVRLDRTEWLQVRLAARAAGERPAAWLRRIALSVAGLFEPPRTTRDAERAE